MMDTKKDLFYLYQVIIMLFSLICGGTHFFAYMRIGGFASDGGVVHSPSVLMGGDFWLNADCFMLVVYLALFVMSTCLHKGGAVYRAIHLTIQVTTLVLVVLLLRRVLLFSADYSVSMATIYGSVLLTGMNYLKIALHFAMCVIAAIMLFKKGWEKNALK